MDEQSNFPFSDHIGRFSVMTFIFFRLRYRCWLTRSDGVLASVLNSYSVTWVLNGEHVCLCVCVMHFKFIPSYRYSTVFEDFMACRKAVAS